jgi:hypothetical protein
MVNGITGARRCSQPSQPAVRPAPAAARVSSATSTTCPCAITAVLVWPPATR